MIQAFNNGYRLAIEHGLPALLKQLEARAIEESLHRLEGVIELRVRQAGLSNPKPVLELQRKQEEFTMKLTHAKTSEEKNRYQHYLTALEWALHANGLPTHQA